MKKVFMTIIFFVLAVALIIYAVLPVASEVKNAGNKSFASVKSMSDNIK